MHFGVMRGALEGFRKIGEKAPRAAHDGEIMRKNIIKFRVRPFIGDRALIAVAGYDRIKPGFETRILKCGLAYGTFDGADKKRRLFLDLWFHLVSSINIQSFYSDLKSCY